MRRFGRALVAGVIACGTGQTAAAQRLTGVVREGGSSTVIGGAVVSVLDSAGRVTARTITDVNGRYALTPRLSVSSVRVVHIGFRPATRSLTNRGPSDTTIDVTMERIPFVLETVHVQSSSTCGRSSNGRATLELWDQARAALLNSIVAREEKPATVTVMSYDRRMSFGNRRVTQHRARIMTGSSTRPVVAGRSAAELASHGYMDQRGDNQYFAPDADVMFDDAFSADHCFGVQIGSGDRHGQVGLTFEPKAANRRAYVDVRGTLWLDSIASSLVQLDYRYTGVDSVAERAGSGGSIRFQSMKNGVVFINEWAITLPVLRAVGITGRLGVAELSESGGVVLAAEWPDGSNWKARIGAIRGRITERGTRNPVPGVGVVLSGVATTVSDSGGLFSFPLLPPGRYAIEMADSAFARFTAPRTDDRQVDVPRGDTVEANFEVASRESVVDGLCNGQGSNAGTAILIGNVADGTGKWPDHLRVEGEWLAGLAQGSTGVAVTTARGSVEVDDHGGFVLCGIARGGPSVRLRVRLGRRTLADTVLRRLSPTDHVHVIEWNVAPRSLSSAQRSDRGDVSGRVVRIDNAEPVANAEVRMTPSGLSARTDSLGDFSFLDVPAGPQAIDVRRLGYRAWHDTLTVEGRTESIRLIVLTAQLTELDTVRTADKVPKYNSPRLQAFEQRRVKGFGKFITEDDLRKNDMDRLGTYISGRILGLKVVPYKNATLIASNRGGGRLADYRDSHSPVGCWVDVYVDGHPIFTGRGEDPAPNIDLMQVNEFGGIEYYGPGALLPQEFNSIDKSGCGTLLLWTRER